jgi:hypothetical protein
MIDAFFTSGEDDRNGRYTINKDNFQSKKMSINVEIKKENKTNELIDKSNTIKENTDIDIQEKSKEIDNISFNLDNIML